MRAATRRPGARLGWGVLFFAGLQLALAFALDARPELRDREYGLKRARLRARLAERPGRPLVVLLGSSRCLLGFRPADLPPCRTADGREPVVFNGGFYGAGPLLELVCLRRLLADGARPDLVFLEYWPPAEIAEGLFRPAAPRFSWRDLRVCCRYAREPGRLCRDWAGSRLLPCYTARSQLLGEVLPDWLPPRPPEFCRIDGDGWRPCPFGQTEDQRRLLRERTRRDYGGFLAACTPGARGDPELREALALCRREGVRAALVFLPEGTEFRALYGARARADLAADLDRLGRDAGVPVIDARTWMPDDAFADGYHLLPEGARAFTTRFGADVLRPLLLGSSPVAGRQPP